jgi:hypothetical protein
VTQLPPIDTPEQRRELAWSNRRVLAARLRWPAGILEECEQVSTDHPHWHVMWGREVTGRLAQPAGFTAYRRRADGFVPAALRHAFGETLAELLLDVAYLEAFVQAEREREARPLRSIVAE